MLTTIIKLLLSFVSKETDKHLGLIEGTVFKEVRIKNDLWLIVDSARTIMTIGNSLYAHPDRWKDMSESSHYSVSVIKVHEPVHAKRQLEQGIDGWIIKYLTNKKFRWEEEKLAYEQQWKYMIHSGHVYSHADYTRWADVVSGSTYGHMTSFEEAFQWMKVTVEKINV